MQHNILIQGTNNMVSQKIAPYSKYHYFENRMKMKMKHKVIYRTLFLQLV